ALGEKQKLGASGIRSREDVIVVGEVGIERSIPAFSAEGGVELGQGVDVLAGGELHPTEHLVAYQDPEGASVRCEALRSWRDDRLLVSLRQAQGSNVDDAVIGSCPQLLPLIQKRRVDLAHEFAEPL